MLLFISLFFYSCASNNSYQVLVNSIARQDSLQKTTYVLASGDEKVNVQDLQFLEYAEYVHKGLMNKGLKKADKPEDANVIIYLSYGVGEPKTYTYNYSIPTWGQTGYSSSTTTGYISPYTGGYTANTTYTPRYGVTGYIPATQTIVLYTRWLVLSAYDLDTYKISQKLDQVWKTTSVSSGETPDLRRVMPPLVAASWKYWADNSGESRTLNISEYDQEVINIKKKDNQDRSVANTLE